MSGWRRVQLRKVARLGSGHTPSRRVAEYWQDCDIPWLTLADVWQIRDDVTQVVTETKERISRLGLANSAAVIHPAGTVAMSRTASVGYVCILGSDMATSQDYVTWTCGPDLENRYLLWALRGLRSEILGRRQGSTHKTIYMPDIEQISIPLPSLLEQRAVADFLDVETARIDALIAKKRRMIELLRERFLAHIYHAVTGAGVAGPRRSTTVAWIKDLPSHWGTPWVGANYRTQLGKMLNAEAAAGPDQYPYLRNVNVQWDHFELEDLATMHFGPEDRARCELREGDLLVCEGGEVGRAAVWPGVPARVYFQKAIHRVRPIREGNTRFLMYCLRAAASLDVFAVEGNQSTIVHLTGEKLREHRFPFPPLAEQARVVDELDAHRDRVELITRRLDQQIKLLQEHRQALITAAVTGELEVPGVAA